MKKRISSVLLSLLMVAFVTTVFNSCGPKDADIQTAVTAAISALPDMGGISAAVKDGAVTLTGECKDDASKAALEAAVKAVKGVKSVVNNTTVAPPPPPPAPVEISADDILSKAVNDAIKDYSGVKAEVKDGVVTLTGEIKKADLPKLMQTVMASKPKKVDNKLVIK